MLGRTHRFHGRKALNVVYRRGRTVRSPALNLRFAARPSGKPYRVAIVVSRKVSKSAVQRNRIRRRIYAAIGDVAARPAGLPGLDLIFTVFDERLADVPAEELGRSVAELIDKAVK